MRFEQVQRFILEKKNILGLGALQVSRTNPEKGYLSLIVQRE